MKKYASWRVPSFFQVGKTNTIKDGGASCYALAKPPFFSVDTLSNELLKNVYLPNLDRATGEPKPKVRFFLTHTIWKKLANI